MKKELTDEEKKIAEELFKNIRDEIKASKHDERVENVIKKIVKLSKEGLKEDEILAEISDDVVILDADGEAAIARMLELY